MSPPQSVVMSYARPARSRHVFGLFGSKSARSPAGCGRHVNSPARRRCSSQVDFSYAPPNFSRWAIEPVVAKTSRFAASAALVGFWCRQ